MSTKASDAIEPRPAPVWRVPERVSYWAVQLAPFVLALVAYVAAFYAMRPDSTGDEPAYLLAAQSLAYDGDLDLVNDYASRDRVLRVFSAFPIEPAGHAVDLEETGQLRPVRGVGFSALLAPAVGLGGETGARLLMVLIAALLADQLFRLLRDLGFRRTWGVLAWVAVALCYPMLVFSSQVYPELPGALILVVVLRIIVRWASSPFALVIGASAAGLLPWLHVRFAVLSVGAFLGLFVAACRARIPGGGPRAPGARGVARAARSALVRGAGVVRREWRTVTVPLVVPFVSSIALLAATSYHLYGTVDATEPYDTFARHSPGDGGWLFLYQFAISDLFDPVYGWIPYVPVHWLGLAALGCLVVKWRWAALACIAVPIGYWLVLASAGLGQGWQFPARLLIPIIPFVAVPLALAIREVRGARVVFIPLLGVSLLFAGAAANQHLHLYSASDRARLAGLRTIDEIFPITNPASLASSYVLEPGQFGPNTGSLQGNTAVARPGDPPGHLLFGPLSMLKRGSYRATFQLAASGASRVASVADLEATSSPPTKVLAHELVTAGELPSRRLGEVTLDFENTDGGLIQTSVFYHGVGTVRAGDVRVDAVDVPTGSSGRLPDWPKAFAWVLGTFAAGWLLVLAMRRGDRRVSPGSGT